MPNEQQSDTHNEKKAMKSDEISNDDYEKSSITILLQPEEKQIIMPRPKTAYQLLETLNLRRETALVIREGQLLTLDRRIYNNDSLIVRKVASSG